MVVQGVLSVEGNLARIHRAKDTRAERMNQTVMERVQRMLAHAKFPTTF